MSTKQDETSPPKLKAVLKISGKLHDVFLDEEEIVWTLQGELNAGIL